MKLDLSEIRTDGGTQPRSEIDMGVVAEYAEDMKRGENFPPVQVMYDGQDYWLYDGFHRLRAAEKLGHGGIEAEVHQGTKEDAQWASLAANKRHGLRRSQADKRRAIKRALKGWGEKKSNNQIAQHIGCSDRTVGKYRRELESTSQITKSTEREGADGRTIDTSNIGGSSTKSNPESASFDEHDQTPPSRGDSAPKSRPSGIGLGGSSGEHKSGTTTEESVTPEEAVRRVCTRLESVAEEGSRLNAELTELVNRAEEDKLPAHVIDKLRSTIEDVAKRLLSYSRPLAPNLGSRSLYNYDE